MMGNQYSLNGTTFKLFWQTTPTNCGSTCLKMIANYYGCYYPLQLLDRVCNISHAGTTMWALNKAGQKLGFRTLAVQIPLDKLDKVLLPCIVHLINQHFVVIFRFEEGNIWIADPGSGYKIYKMEQIAVGLINFGHLDDNKVNILLLEPTSNLHRKRTMALGSIWFCRFQTLIQKKVRRKLSEISD